MQKLRAGDIIEVCGDVLIISKIEPHTIWLSPISSKLGWAGSNNLFPFSNGEHPTWKVLVKAVKSNKEETSSENT